MRDESIAIVGVGCRFPGGVHTPEQLWDRLLEGFDAFRDVPGDRWDHDRFYDPNPDKPGKMNVEQGAFVDHPIFELDPEPFGITPAAAEQMDPQQRLLLETTWEALENGGISLDQLRQSPTGVFIGGFTLDNMTVQYDVTNHHLLDRDSPKSASHTMLSNRISYLFDLKGPSLTIDTACSSSLTAAHYACQSIWSGESDQAIVGGVNVMLRPGFPIAMSKGGFLSPHSRCMMFDERAAGYARGEGAGVVVLKPLSEARKDGDRVYASIVATGVNQDGKTSGISRPSQEAQVKLLGAVLDGTGIEPGDVRYVEAHGTGTQAGDKAEAGALEEAFGGATRDSELLVGSIKTNIGHLEAAAGVAGLIKAALCLHHRTVPRNLHFDRPNPDIPFDENCLEVPRRTRRLEGRPLYAGVNSFGYGGTNAHVLLQSGPEATDHCEAVPPPRSPLLFPLSACSSDALRQRAEDWADRLETRPDLSLSDALHTAIRRSSHHRHRLVGVADHRRELIDRLRAAADGRTMEGVVTGRVGWNSSDVVFVYTGMGPQWWGMGRGLVDEPVFRESLDQFDELFGEVAGWSVIEEMSRPEDASRIGETRVAQPANFGLQYALTRLWASRGIEPVAVVGHSVGEVAAAWASGALTLEEAVVVSYHRSRLQQAVAVDDIERGAMLAAGIGEGMAERLVGQYEGTCIAAVNSASNVTFSGRPEAIERLAKELENRKVFHRVLDVEVAYHSHFMDPVKDKLQRALCDLEPGPTDTPLFSTVTGELIEGEEIDGAYWSRNMRRPVRFRDALEAMLNDGYRTFVEVGPHPVLRQAISETFRQLNVDGVRYPSIRRREDEKFQMLETLGALHARGAEIRWESVTSTQGRFVPPPPYPWQRSYYWKESRRSRLRHYDESIHPLLQTPLSTATPSWQTELTAQKLPWIPDHVIDDTTIFPGAGYIEAAMGMARSVESSWPVILEDVDLQRLLALDDAKVVDLQVHFDGEHRWRIASKQRGGGNWTDHAQGRVGFGEAPSPELGSVDEVARRLAGDEVDTDALYTSLKRRGLEYGCRFRTLRKLHVGEDEVLAELAAETAGEDYVIHPTVLDGAFQAVTATISGEETGNPLVPVSVRRIEWYRPVGSRARAFVEVREHTEGGVIADISLYTDDEIAGRLEEVAFQPLAVETGGEGEPVDYRFAWKQVREAPPQETAPKTLVVAEGTVGGLLSDNESALTASWSTGHDAPDRQGHRVSIRQPREMKALCEREEIERVVFIPPVAEDNPVGQLGEVTWGIARVVGQLATLEAPPSVALVYREGRGLLGPSLEPAFRVIRSEYPQLLGRIVVLADDAEGLSWADMERELNADAERETQVASDGRHTRRLVAVEQSSQRGDDPTEVVSTDEPVALQIGEPGKLGSLRYERLAPTSLGADRVRIRVKATPLNFKDLLKFTDQIDRRVTADTFFGHSCGMECVGVVEEVGAGVTEFDVGDRVGTFASEGCFRSIVTPEASTVARLPDATEFREAAASFIPFLTAWHALAEVARLQPGETVLIHSAAGGVGSMAVEIARHLGARVTATAGTEHKRQLLRDAGVESVSNSRNLEYVDQVRRWTDGRGVDVVLSAQSGTPMQESARLLSRYGRYIDIGKRAQVDNESLPLRPFNEALTYSAIDMDRLLDDDPAYCIAVVEEGLELIAGGKLEPPAVTTYGAGGVVDAFRYMATGDHFGRLVIDYDEQTVEVTTEPPGAIRPDGWYVVTGGLGGFGRRVAEFLADRGATRLLLLSRRGMEAPQADELVGRLTDRGVDARVAAVDVTDRDALERALAEIRQCAPIRGAFHCAMVLRDELISSLTREGLDSVLAPKALGAWHLHELTTDDPLEHFVNFSSVSAIVGTAGQFSYATANGFLDALSDARRRAGDPAVSVQWGVLGEVGIAARNEQIRRNLEEAGLIGLDNRTALEGLQRALRWEHGQLGVFDIDWQRWSNRFPELAAVSVFDEVRSHDAETAPLLELARSILPTEPSGWTAELAERIRPQIAEILQIDPEVIPYDEPLSNVGVDSLLASEVAGELNAGGYAADVVELVGGSSIRDIADETVKHLEEMCREKFELVDAGELTDRERAHLTEIASTEDDEESP